MRMEAGAPFLVALAPPLVLGQWRYTLHPRSLMWPQLPPLPPEAKSWAEFTDRLTRRTLAFRGHPGDRLVTRLF